MAELPSVLDWFLDQEPAVPEYVTPWGRATALSHSELDGFRRAGWVPTSRWFATHWENELNMRAIDPEHVPTSYGEWVWRLTPMGGGMNVLRFFELKDGGRPDRRMQFLETVTGCEWMELA